MLESSLGRSFWYAAVRCAERRSSVNRMVTEWMRGDLGEMGR